MLYNLLIHIIIIIIIIVIVGKLSEYVKTSNISL
jgi:hypothetical protein